MYKGIAQFSRSSDVLPCQRQISELRFVLTLIVKHGQCRHIAIAQMTDHFSIPQFDKVVKLQLRIFQLERQLMHARRTKRDNASAHTPLKVCCSQDDAGTDMHKVGYVAYYPTPLSEDSPLPLVLAFHGGGDSAFHIAWVSGWWRVAMRNRFLLVCLENHLNVTATEVMSLIGQLKEKYPIDSSRIYASGFSMGGCKSWDLFQEYPESFAALAPMDATFEVGLNLYGQPAPKPINRDIPVPVYYAAGEKTPLPEMPCQADKCMERARYVFEVNQVVKPYNLVFDDRESWEEPFWGVPGDRVEKIPDLSRGAILTEHRYVSKDGVYRTVFAGVDNQGHECREHTCERAWQFMKDFTR